MNSAGDYEARVEGTGAWRCKVGGCRTMTRQVNHGFCRSCRYIANQRAAIRGLECALDRVRRLPEEWLRGASSVNPAGARSPSILVDCAEELRMALEDTVPPEAADYV